MSEGELFRLLFETAEIATFTPQEKLKLENDMRTERDLRDQNAYAREEGVEEGFEKGIEAERSRMVSELRQQGVSEEVIARVAGMAK